MTGSDLATPTFWRELLERAARQAAQTFAPIVAAVVGGGHPFDLAAVAIAVAGAVAVTVLKALSGIMLHPDEAWYWQLLDRAVPAVAGTALGFVPVSWTDIIHVQWTQVAYASLGAGVIALLSAYVAPPAAVHSSIRGRHAADPRGSAEHPMSATP